MIRNLKVLGLALWAMLALGATAASSASAVDTFTSVKSPETITGVNPAPHSTSANRLFVTSASGGELSNVECTTSKFHGNVNNGALEATFTAEYTGTKNVVPHTTDCTSSLGAATVTMNGCAYILTGNTTKEDPVGGGKDAIVSIECTPSTNEITMHIPGAGVTFEIPAQTPTEGGLKYTNEAGKVRIKATATGITYTCTPAFVCGLGGIASEGNKADYIGVVLAHGANGNISYSES
jgi:hypothetical protein